MSTQLTIRSDGEYNADEFWDALDAEFPEVAGELRRCDEAAVTPEQWAAIQALPGFGDGPEYAPAALTAEPEGV